jgi:hypothetical protein
MNESMLPKRREFLGQVATGAVALGLSGALSKAFAGTPATASDVQPSDKWLSSVTGKHKQFFDMPNHQNGMGLIHVRNYLNTLRDTYKVSHPDATAVVSLYGMSTLMGFNDAMWKKYGLGTVLKANDASGSPATSNVFYSAPAGAASMNLSGAPIPLPTDVSISALQQRGAVFIMCNNAFNLWMMMLSGGQDKMAPIRKEFEDNMLPGIFLVPAMVVAVNQAQMHGCTYMYL